jgi:hypothetical protein
MKIISAAQGNTSLGQNTAKESEGSLTKEPHFMATSDLFNDDELCFL